MNVRTLFGVRGLFGTWGALAACAAVVAVTLEILGPPVRSGAGLDLRQRIAAGMPPIGAPAPAPAPVHKPGTIAPPDLALLAAIPDQPGRMLPVIGSDGRLPLAAYAAMPPPVLPNQARLALLVDGIGLDEATSAAAITELPAPVDVAFSPYADENGKLAAAARARGHEMLVSIPMERWLTARRSWLTRRRNWQRWWHSPSATGGRSGSWDRCGR